MKRIPAIIPNIKGIFVDSQSNVSIIFTNFAFMSPARKIYRVVRSVLFSAIALIAALYLLLYVAVSIPPVQSKVAKIIEKELSAFLGAEVTVGRIEIFPFNEAVVHDLALNDLTGTRCLTVDKLGAGIDLSSLVFDKKIIVTYAELIGLDARIYQAKENQPLNIQFIIDAFAPKDKNKPPTKFDLALHSVVIRNCYASFDREWMPRVATAKIDFNHLFIRDLKADVDIPRLSNEDYLIDLRRLSLEGPGGLSLRTLSLKAHITPSSLSVKDLVVKLPGTDIRPADFSLSFPSLVRIGETLREDNMRMVLVGSRVTPSDLSAFYPPLARLNTPFLLSLDVSGNLSGVNVSELSIKSEVGDELHLNLRGEATGLDKPKENLRASLHSLSLEANASSLIYIADVFSKIPEKHLYILEKLGHISLTTRGSCSLAESIANLEADLRTSLGKVTAMGSVASFNSPVKSVSTRFEVSELELGTLLSNKDLGLLSAAGNVTGRFGVGGVDGSAEVNVQDFFFKGTDISGINASVNKSGKAVSASVSSLANNAIFDLSTDLFLDGQDSKYALQLEIDRFVPSSFGILPAFPGYQLDGVLSAEVYGNNPDNITGFIRGRDIAFIGDGERGSLKFDRLDLSVDRLDDGFTDVELSSDFVEASVKGVFSISSLPNEFRYLLSRVVPAFIAPPSSVDLHSAGEFSLAVKPCDRLLEFFNIPVRVLVPLPISGAFDMNSLNADVSFDLPYLQQGKDKLVRDTYFSTILNGDSGFGEVRLHTLYPSKKGDAELDIDISASQGEIDADLGWKIEQMKGFAGSMSLSMDTGIKPFDKQNALVLKVNPSSFVLSDADWRIGEASVTYVDKCLSVEGFNVWHDNQFIRINGVASASRDDVMLVSLSDIDLGFIFDTLNINYVTFGGIATGELSASGVFSSNPEAATRSLFVKDLSYNECVLGDADIKSRWVNEEKEVEIKADIESGRHKVAELDGGIWVTADSLNFRIDADKVNIGFLKPFMAAFTSDVGGRASGWANLYGNFHDIDLKGRLFADSISMKVDYTNVYYHGSDSVRIDPGHIEIPSFRLYDKYGNSAMLSGWVSHNYFHEPRFEFKIDDVKKLLCYDTNPSINPVWYGRVFGNGSGRLRGWPGGVVIDIDMATAEDSNFTFVISDEAEVGEYNFLTFSDLRKEAKMAEIKDSVPDFVSRFRRQVEQKTEIPSLFSLNLFATITPDALLTIVMDPKAGDKITARGSGPMQMSYDSESENLSMYGKYTLDEGKYNFILQELILRDFLIRPGSSIAFNGDPLRANLDISAAYRVNTNLSDLDESFSYDPELNRTNVPVDAVLNISGEMDHPDISFDIELPTLTSDVARKVRSIVSTDDMMNRQVLYLLALNRFYTPEYMGNSGNGGELASVASSTLSSQLSRIVGQITDKVTLAPSFRSDKGDFSDFEMDLALSSRLLDNRLLLNGNFGYRDRSTSSTTFIGDFDIEYLLNRSGNLRLKAYNHFNDQNYYLKSALTTQGIGVAYRRDFDNILSFLRRSKRRKPFLEPTQEPEPETSSDTVNDISSEKDVK